MEMAVFDDQTLKSESIQGGKTHTPNNLDSRVRHLLLLQLLLDSESQNIPVAQLQT